MSQIQRCFDDRATRQLKKLLIYSVLRLHQQLIYSVLRLHQQLIYMVQVEYSVYQLSGVEYMYRMYIEDAPPWLCSKRAAITR